jgi:endonuclease/exonuclease/phosphatase family metal-dependent hydrolase
MPLASHTNVHALSSYYYISGIMLDQWNQCGSGKGYTFSSEKPDRRIDFMWLSNNQSQIKCVSATNPITKASDHLPLSIAFRTI